jgi:hypothetical protein
MAVGHPGFGGAGYTFRALIGALYSRQARAGPMS